jgi:citrate synthase
MGTSAGTGPRTVGQIMSRPVVTALPSETLQMAADSMTEQSVGSVVVVEDGRPIGILTERDLVRLAAAGANARKEIVRDWMVRDPDTVEPTVEVDAALHRLSERGYRHIPVVHNGDLVGLVSMRDLMKIAEVRQFGTLAIDVPKGLKGVVVAETEIGDVRGTEGFYHYRQYNAIELAEKCSLEEVWYLLHEGRLPNPEELEALKDEIRTQRVIPADMKDLLASIARLGESFVPLEALRSSLSLMASSWDFKPWLDVDRAALKLQALRVCAVIPTLVTALHRLNHGLEPVEPHPDLPYAANYLYMWKGEEPPPQHARAIEKYMISTIDHGFNASTFTARVVTSTGADLGSAIVAAISALSGPLHGGAPSRALEMLDAIETREDADEWIRSRIQKGQRIMGFGHPVYKTDDPRSNMLRNLAKQLGGPRVEFAEYIESKVIELLEELKPGRQLRTNVEFYAAICMESIGLPPDLFTPTFACSRAIGWTAHILEQAADNRIIRPSGRYTGPPPPQPIDREVR